MVSQVVIRLHVCAHTEKKRQKSWFGAQIKLVKLNCHDCNKICCPTSVSWCWLVLVFLCLCLVVPRADCSGQVAQHFGELHGGVFPACVPGRDCLLGLLVVDLVDLPGRQWEEVLATVPWACLRAGCWACCR